MALLKLLRQTFLLALTTIPLAGTARLGETERECFNRYSSARPLPPGLGKPADLIPGARHLNYIHEGWLIRVAFWDGRVAAEEYRKLAPYKTGAAITDDEMTAILEAEKGKGTWKRLIFGPGGKGQAARVFTQFLPVLGQKIWERSSDGSRAATNPGHYSLYLWTPVAAKQIEKAKTAKEAEKKRSIPNF